MSDLPLQLTSRTTEPAPAPVTPTFTPLTPPTSTASLPALTPLSPRLPQNLARAQNKYSTLAPVINQLPPAATQAVARLDAQRLARGSPPLTTQQTIQALAAAAQERAITEPPRDRNPFNPLEWADNIRTDLSAIVQSIPRLPGALVEEIRDLPDIPEHIARATAAGDNPFAALASAPGVRLIPGAFVAENLARGDISNLAEHPLFTFLDVLPAAKAAAGATRAGTLANEIRATPRALGEARPIGPIRAALTRTVDETGALTRNRLGELTGPAAEAIQRTRPGQLALEAFGQGARDATRIYNQFVSAIQDAASPKGTATNEALSLVTRESASLLDRHPNISTDTARDLTRRMQFDDLNGIPDEQLAFVNDARELTERLARQDMALGNVIAIDGEIYDLTTGSKISRLRNSMYDARDSVREKVLPRVDKIRGALDPENNARLEAVYEGINRGDFDTAYREWVNIGQRAIGARAQLPGVKVLGFETVRRRLARAAVAERQLNRFIRNNPSARWMPILQEQVRGRLRELYERPLDPANPAAVAEHNAAVNQAITDGIFERIPGYDPTDLRRIQSEVQRTWQDLKASGIDPIYVHHVSPERAQLDLTNPRVFVHNITPSHAKRRTMDFAPSTDNVAIALPHQALELLVERGTREFNATLTRAFGDTRANIREQYYPDAQRAALRDPSRSVGEHLDALLRRDFEPFDPDNAFRPLGQRTPATEAQTGDTILLPKTVAKTLHRLQPPPATRVSAAWDGVMGLFRTSVLPLSPRWQAYNLFGGGIMTSAQASPAALLRVGEATRLLASPEARAALPADLVRTLGSSPKEILALEHTTGTTLRRWANEVQDARARGLLERLDKGFGPGRKLVDKSFQLNSLIDDKFRVISYLYGRDKAARLGLSEEAARRAGVELARKTMQQWDEITPIERSIVRQIFPFYSFMQHILRFVYNYPHDHPIRTAITASFARAELEDLGSGLPQSFLNLFTWGKRDKEGNQKALSFQGLNPFADVADYMTLAGFLGSTNPVISTVLQSAGIKMGEADLYPTLHYDPSTGRMVADTGNPILNFINNTIPQTRLLTNMLGWNREYRELLQSNPEAAMRMLRSQAGLPVGVRTINIPQEYAREEIQRDQARRDALNAALRTGETGGADDWEQNAEILANLRLAQEQGLLSDYQLPQNEVQAGNAAEVFGRIFSGYLTPAQPAQIMTLNAQQPVSAATPQPPNYPT